MTTFIRSINLVCGIANLAVFAITGQIECLVIGVCGLAVAYLIEGLD